MSVHDQWVGLFVDALHASRHRDWSDDTVLEVAMICADAVAKVIAGLDDPPLPGGPLTTGTPSEGYL